MNDSRERFEAWAGSEGWTSFNRLSNGDYVYSGLNDAWDVWQAAERQALERAAQACQELIDGDELDVEQKSGAYDARNAIRALIEQSASKEKQ